jgi:hypothetical protein
MTNWIEIHPDFVKENDWGEVNQQLWEEQGLTYQDAQEWISAGFEPGDYLDVEEWKSYNFTPQQAKVWKGVDSSGGYVNVEFAAYL